MSNFENLFDEDTIETISGLVESKMPLLNQIPTFKEKDKEITSHDIFALHLFKVAQALKPVKKRTGNYYMILI